MPIYKYRRIPTPGPNGTTMYFRNTDEPRAIELAEVDDWHYVSVPEGVALPEQAPEIEWQAVTLTDDLRERIKAVSRACHLIADRMQQMIRGAYSLEDEQYFARIGVGVALGVYQFQAGEEEALLAFGAHVEAVRQWGRDERAKLGL
ncbi:hypothetical protein [Thauera aromatica]|uniref:hypothetical protein n=1 Tax=Thauera aromatica TaxID=59405 RepID=UPI001FFDB408|nr:hypothetical protein [Thauera aromatica]MCK2095649.1 hypothetical protein [Thauera aromatica]